MTKARNYATDYVVHALPAKCNARARDAVKSSNPEDVTCKRCLKALAKKA
jgi:hypothetical protein